MRVTLVIYSLGSGGAERIISIMANYWAHEGWEVTILTLENGKEPPFFQLHPQVMHSSLGLAAKSSGKLNGLQNNITRAIGLRKAIIASKPQVVISFMDMTNIITLLATIGLRLPVIVTEHNDPYQRKISAFWSTLRQLAYIRASKLIVLHKTALNYFLPSIRKRGQVLFNPVVLPMEGDEETGPSRDEHSKVVIAMGRLVEQKGFDMLLHAFAKIAAKHPDWSLEVWGDGPLRGNLEKLRDQLGIEKNVNFPGKTKSPLQKMKQADLFVLSSRYEGFPTVLCEAMACGLPVVSFDCPTGPDEIIRDGTDGILVPPGNIDALANAMDLLMSDEKHRCRISSHAPEVLERFGLKKTMDIWNDLLTQAKIQ